MVFAVLAIPSRMTSTAASQNCFGMLKSTLNSAFRNSLKLKPSKFPTIRAPIPISSPVRIATSMVMMIQISAEITLLPMCADTLTGSTWLKYASSPSRLLLYLCTMRITVITKMVVAIAV